MKRVVAFLSAEAGLLVGGVTAGSAMTGEFHLWMAIAAVALLVISGAIYWSAETDRKSGEKKQQDRLDDVLKSQGTQAQELRTFINKGHSWSLGDVGRCAEIPNGSRLVELNDGSYRIAEPVRLKADLIAVGTGSAQMAKRDDE